MSQTKLRVIENKNMDKNTDENDTSDSSESSLKSIIDEIKTEDITLRYGEIHPNTLKKFELGYPAIGGEIHW